MFEMESSIRSCFSVLNWKKNIPYILILKKYLLHMIYLYHKIQDMCFQNELHKPQAATIAFQAAQ